jgi:SsrA-binding protein
MRYSVLYNRVTMSKKKANAPKTIQNKRARFDYELGDALLVGLELTGAEVKSLRLGHGNLRGAYVTVKDNELYLLNGTINGTNGVAIAETDQTRTRRLLAKRREIDALIEAKKQGRTIVPLELLTGTRYIKLRIAVGKGKRNYDKRQVLKKRDEDRQARAAIKPR